MKFHGLLITVCILLCLCPTDGWLWGTRRRRSSAQAPPADTTPPTFTNCRSHWTVPITTISTVVTWTEPTATDDRPIRMHRSGPAPGSTFTEGHHAVIYTAQDLSGNKATCRIEFTVKNVQPSDSALVSYN
ncbi:hyalin-like [Apostichopus japonicus]|uniref:hyalin-like n=1 Tax=Stichopus japonicus TaxID=307972 RepID=UPI003AB39141